MFFRSFTQKTASLLGVNGWVRNLYDGSVEAVFEGDKPSVEEAVNKCRTGPYGAHVEDVKVEWQPWSGEFRGFSVRY